MPRLIAVVIGLFALLAAPAGLAADPWKEGTHYFLISPPQRTSVPAGKVEVLEVFSYGCPACYSFEPVMRKLAAALPANARIAHLPAAFNPSEGWPMFQRAYLAAQAMGIADRTHQAMYDAVWKTGELGIVDPATGKLKKNLPTIEDAARFYAREAGVKPEAFLATAKSFAIDARMKAADRQIIEMRVDRTPTLVVNGKYRLHAQSAGGYDELIALVKWLVEKESDGKT